MSDKKGKKEDADLAQQDVLQAIVLADSFASNFRPITFEMPKVLHATRQCANDEYTLEFLAAGGVQEIYIFCCAHADEVERYVVDSELAASARNGHAACAQVTGKCTSAGDALREMDALGVIRIDFVLVPGDVIANLSLAARGRSQGARAGSTATRCSRR